jgi:hypothetical protein
MAITTGDGYIAASKQILPFTKTASVTASNNNLRYGVFATAGNPGAGTLALTTALTGVVPTDATAGYPAINSFGSGNTGYLTRVQYANTVAARMEIWDKLFGFNFACATLQTFTLSSQADYSGRIPSAAYSGLRIFVEVTTTFSGTATTVTATYTDQSGNTGHTTGSSGSMSGFTANRWVELSLQAGDSGVQKIESVIVGGATNTNGVANILVCRPIWTNRVQVTNGGGLDGLDRTGMPIVYDTSALTLTVIADATSTGIPDMNLEIANG